MQLLHPVLTEYSRIRQEIHYGTYSETAKADSSLDAAPPHPKSPFVWGLPRKPPARKRASLVHQIQGCHPHWRPAITASREREKEKERKEGEEDSTEMAL